jgi:hypothetical protein
LPVEPKIQRIFQEKKECYIGLLDAYHRAAVENSNEAAKILDIANALRISCSQRSQKGIQEIVNTNADPKRRDISHENLKDVLRKDMAIVK